MKRIHILTITLLLASSFLLPIRAAAAQSANKNNMIRLVYFLPNDRPARPESVAAFQQSIKEAQQFFADEMERHGHGRKTFVIYPIKTENLSFIMLMGNSETNIIMSGILCIESGKILANILMTFPYITFISLR